MKSIQNLAKTKLVIILIMSTTFLTYANERWKSKENKPYYFSTTLSGSLEEVTEKVKTTLKNEGFGVITETDMHEKLHAAIKKDVKPYRLLGVCDPSSAYDALMIEDHIGLMLPCKIIIREISEKRFEVASIDPQILMDITGNDSLASIGKDVSKRLKKVISDLN